MISNWLSAALARRNIHYGWVMVGVTFLTALITAGTVGAPGVFIVPLQHEFGWTTAEISSALSIRFILFGLMAPFAAALLNRYGLRNVTLSALLIVASALVVSLGMTKALAIDAAVGRRDRHRHRHDRAGAGRDHRGALVRRAARSGGWNSHRQRRHRTIGVPAAARQHHRTDGLADRTGIDLRHARRRGLCGADDHARSSRAMSACGHSATTARSPCRRRRPATRRSWRQHLARCAMPPKAACSGFCFLRFSSAAPAPTA